MGIDTDEIKALVLKYEIDIRRGGYRTEIIISRSRSRQLLRQTGQAALSTIGARMKLTFAKPPYNYEMLMAYVWLIEGIIEDNNLPKGPYQGEVLYTDQDPSAWIKYCEDNAD